MENDELGCSNQIQRQKIVPMFVVINNKFDKYTKNNQKMI